MAEQSGDSGGKKPLSVFNRRPGSSSLSTNPNTFGRKKEDSSEGNNAYFNPKKVVKRKLLEGFEDLQPPRPFTASYGTHDAFDIHDVNPPVDNSIDTASLDFIHLAKEVTKNPVPREKMTSIVEDGGVRKRMLLGGLPSIPVTDGCRVWIHYEMYVEKGESLVPLDSTTQHGLATSLEVGQDGLLGLYHAVKSMQKKEIAEFCLDPEYAYGKRGIPYFIEGNQRLRVIIQMADISIKTRKSIAFMSPIERRSMDLPLEEIFEDVEKLIKAGHTKFDQTLYRDACDRYNWALDMLQDFRVNRPSQFTPEHEAVDKKSYQLYSNLALCFNRLEDYEEAEKSCKAALALVYPRGDLKPKILYRYAVAMYHLKRYDEAVTLCNRGLRCDSRGEEFQIMLHKINIAKDAQKEEPEADDVNLPAKDEEPLELDPDMENDFVEDDDNEAWGLTVAFKNLNVDKYNRSG